MSATEAGLVDEAPPLEPPADGTSPEPPPPSRRVRNVLEWVVVLSVAAAMALLLRAYVVQTYYIPSPSMEPTLLVGDHILVLKAAYDFTSPATGDVIVFKAPPREHELCNDPNVQDLVKRIIATPGETVWSRGHTIYLDNKPLVQRWQYSLALGFGPQIATRAHPLVVPRNDYFVMGDNHGQSCDSRIWGFVPRANIIGKAIAIYWPLSRLSTI